MNDRDGVRIAPGKGARFVGSILAAIPQNHRVYGEADGSVVIVATRRTVDEELSDELDDEDEDA